MSIDSSFVNRYYEVLKRYNEVEKFIEDLIDFQEQWKAKELIDFIKIADGCKNDRNRIEIIKKKIFGNIQKCVIFGSNSTGKSTLINALLQHPYLPCGNGRTTRKLTEIKKTLDPTSLIQIDNETYPIDHLKKLMLTNDNRKLEVLLNNSNFINEDLVIFDTPSFDVDEENDKKIGDCCEDADYLICVINSDSSLTRSLKNFIREIYSKNTSFNIYLVYNAADNLDIESYNDLENEIMSDAIEFMEEFMATEEANSRIFIISAAEILNIPLDTNDQFIQRRKISFDSFKSTLQEQINDKLTSRRWIYINDFLRIVLGLKDKCVAELDHFNENKTNFSDHILKVLSKYGDVNSKFNELIKKHFQDSFEQFLIEAVRYIRTEKEKKDNNNDTNSRSDTDSTILLPENTMNELSELLEGIIESTLEKLKLDIIAYINNPSESFMNISENDNEEPACWYILEKLYIPLYFDVNRELQMFNFESLEQILLKIAKVMRDGKIGTIIVTTLVGAATIATGGALIPILAPIEATVLAVSGSAAIGGTVGAAAGGTTSASIMKIVNLPFRPFWKEEERQIKELWTPLEVALIDSYSKFIDEIDTNVNHLIFPLLGKLKNIETRLNNFSNTIKREQAGQ